MSINVRNLIGWKSFTIVLSLFLIMPLFEKADSGDVADISYGSYSLSVIPKNVDKLKRMKVFIEDPEDEMILNATSRGSPVEWAIARTSPDGVYKIDVYLLVVDPDAENGKEGDDTNEKLLRKSDSFKLIDSRIVPRNQNIGKKDGLQGFRQEVNRKFSRFAANVMNCFVAKAYAENLTAESERPKIFFDDTQDEDPPSRGDWFIITEGGESDSDKNNSFIIKGYSETNRVPIPIITIYNDGRNVPGLDSGNSLVVEDNGDMRFASSGLFFDKSSGFLSINKTAGLEEEFTIYGVNPEIALWDSSNENRMNLEFDNDEFTIEGGEPERDIVRINHDAPENSLVIDEEGAMTVDWAGSKTAEEGLKTLMKLQANNSTSDAISDAGFSLRNVKEDFQWNFRTSELAQGFSATKKGTGGNEFLIRNKSSDYRNVSIVMGNGALCSPQGQWLDASSRNYKENIEFLGSEEAVEAFKELNPVKYCYKNDADKEVNVGFIAEEVPSLVASKQRKSMSAMEVAALLTEVVQKQQREIREYKKILQKQQQKISSINKKIAQFEKTNSFQPSNRE